MPFDDDILFARVKMLATTRLSAFRELVVHLWGCISFGLLKLTSNLSVDSRVEFLDSGFQSFEAQCSNFRIAMSSRSSSQQSLDKRISFGMESKLGAWKNVKCRIDIFLILSPVCCFLCSWLVYILRSIN